MKVTVIGISGGSCSGKTTFVNRLKRRFGKEITVLSHDSYYVSRDNMSDEEKAAVNYDHPDALETELLIRHIKSLKRGRWINCPIYDFEHHTRRRKTVRIMPSKIIIVEGVLIFADEELRKLFDLKIFIDSDADERLARRVKRDMRDRGRSAESVVTQYLATVKPMHEQYVEPGRSIADIVINGGTNRAAFEMVKGMIENALSDKNDGKRTEG